MSIEFQFVFLIFTRTKCCLKIICFSCSRAVTTPLLEAEAGTAQCCKVRWRTPSNNFPPEMTHCAPSSLLAACNHEAGSKNRRAALRALPSETSIWSVLNGNGASAAAVRGIQKGREKERAAAHEWVTRLKEELYCIIVPLSLCRDDKGRGLILLL